MSNSMVTSEALTSIDLFGNQVIYSSGPEPVPKADKIQKVVQKLSHEQESAGSGGVRTGTKT